MPPAVDAPAVPSSATTGQDRAVSGSGVAEAAPRPATASRGVVEALAPDRYLIKFTASAVTRDKLRTAQDLLHHAVPTRDLAEVIDRALTVLIEQLERRKFGRTETPRPGHVRRHSRYIPAEVRRAVWKRDGGRCAFVSADGRRCTARSHLEFHHLTPYEVGGPSTVDNLELRCRVHNQYEADRYYGAFRAAAEGDATRPGTSWKGAANMAT
jgi:5-methylcytosine-specific restriction endonuclease McrA